MANPSPIQTSDWTSGSIAPLNSTHAVQGGSPGEATHPTNDAFLQLMFGEDLAHAVVCSNTTAPDTTDEAAKRGMWKCTTLTASRERYKSPQRQNYTCVASFHLNADGSINRTMAQFRALHFIVLDDIGSKVAVDPRTFGLGEPTCIIETSPENHQWFYRLTQPVRDATQAEYLMKQVLATPVQGHEMTDQGAKGITRLCKLPQGMNLKLKLGLPWQNRVVSWRPELSYTAQEIASWFSNALDKAPASSLPLISAARPEVSSQHPLILALRDAGLLKSEKPSNTGWWHITCPQVDEHSDQLDDGTAVMVRNDGSWTMKCQHGHCADLKPQHLYDELVKQGFSVPHPQQRDHALITANFEVLEGSAFIPRNMGINPIIKLEPGDLPIVMSQCAAMLNDVVYKRGGLLVRIGLEPTMRYGHATKAHQASVVQVTANWLKRELTQRTVFLRWDARAKGYVKTDCPAHIAKALEDGTDDATFKRLTALSTAPFLREDGTVCETPGYDEATGIYYAPSMEFPKLLDNPGETEARAALDEILDLVKQFPFANGVSRSVFLADVLTALSRPTLPKSPMVLYTASMAGSGKTLMASIPNLIAHGHAANHPWPNGNEEELRKVFTAGQLAGDPVIVFDNVPNGYEIKSAALAQFVTSEEYSDRKLGESERLRFINRTRIVLTGNNVTLASDNARRTIICELQLKVESLKDRQEVFKHPALASYIKQHRAELIMAGLTVLRAYALHSARLALQPLDSFEEWSWRVREPLIWLGEEDPVKAVDYGNDGSGELGTAFLAIRNVLKDDLERKTEEFTANELAKWTEGNVELRDALIQAGCLEPNSSNSLGYWLRQHKNRLAAGYRLIDKKKTNGGVNKWVISQVSQGLSGLDGDIEV